MGREVLALLEIIPSCRALRSIEKQCGNLKGDFEQFFLTRSSVSFNITQIDRTHLREPQRFNDLISRSWITGWVPSGFHLLPRVKKHLR
jgi:hypothetical protein